MRKRTDSDFIGQKLASRRTLTVVRNPRKFNPVRSQASLKKVFSRTIIPAPRVISFFDSRYDTFSAFLKLLADTCNCGRVLIDLRPVKEVKTAALLVLYANIERLQRLYSDRDLIKTTSCTSREVSVSFRTFGFWNLTRESRGRPKRMYADSLAICTMSKEKHLKNDKAELRKVLVYTRKAFLDSNMDEGDLLAYNAITESISNVWQHAYDPGFFKKDVPDSQKNWWIIVQRIESQFFIAVYDMGSGIPATISAKPWAAALIESFSAMFNIKVLSSLDAKSIKAAVDYGKSRFKLDNRGKGLTEAKDFVQRNPNGSMLIYSGTGHYEYETSTDKENLETLGSPFLGTLIQWNLLLEKKNEAENHN